MSSSFSQTSSFIINAQSASYIILAQSASYYSGSVTSSSYSLSSSFSQTSSFAPNYLLISSTGSMLSPYVLNSSTSSISVLSSSFAISASFALSSSQAITASFIPGIDVWAINITTTSSIDTNTTGSNGFGQNGRHTKISNGANAINVTVQTSSHSDFVGSYEKLGTSNITFLAGTGASLTTLSNTSILSGVAGSKACLSRNGNTYYLQITNY